MAAELEGVGGWIAGAGAGAGRAVAGIAGAFLVWRGVFGRSRGRLVPLVAGALVLRRAFPHGALALRRALRGGARARRRRTPEVVEVKSPAELEPGMASASPAPTFSSRLAGRDDLSR